MNRFEEFRDEILVRAKEVGTENYYKRFYTCKIIKGLCNSIKNDFIWYCSKEVIDESFF